MGVVSVIENRLHKLEDVVKPILESCPETRGDDFLLVYNVYMRLNPSLNNKKFRDIIFNHKSLGLPPFESITRVRRKLQLINKELRPCEEIDTARINDTSTYIEYALDI